VDDDGNRLEIERAKREKLELDQLEAARAKLNQEQLARLERYAASLREQDIYAPRHETAIAEILRIDDYQRKQGVEIDKVISRAAQETPDQARQEQVVARAQELKDAGDKREQQAEREHQAQQKLEAEARDRKEREAKELAAHEAAKREPIPGTMQRFNAILAESRAQREAQTHGAAIDHAAQAAEHRPNYARYNDMKQTVEPSRSADQQVVVKYTDKSETRGEISEAKAERLAKMFDRPSTEKDFDATHDPNNSRNFAGGRGGRGER
jgi:colicin import membrane protein